MLKHKINVFSGDPTVPNPYSNPKTPKPQNPIQKKLINKLYFYFGLSSNVGKYQKHVLGTCVVESVLVSEAFVEYKEYVSWSAVLSRF